ncbi:MAG: hypothetical protein HQ521_20605 [Bacteroidetes bacterium]|nr:hypothetical protein [Bacteroidota bacterium]
MKTIIKYQKNAIILLVSVFILFTLSTCQKDDDKDTEVESKTNVTGEWEFTLTPLVSYIDTTQYHGATAGDFPEYPATISEVYLYEDESQNIIGEAFGYKIAGIRNDYNVHLNLYVYPEGPYDETISIDSMSIFSSMELSIDKYGYLKGSGEYFEYPIYPNIIYNTYTAQARKIRDITSSYKDTKGWTDKLCNIISKFDSFLISTLTDNIFRPMYGCYGHKDGGGYYVFGHEGPGNRLPIYTATVYFPMEWSWCKVRDYSFSFNLGSEVHSVTKLKEEIQKVDHALDVFHKWGFNDESEFFDHMDDFIQNFGGFAISILYDTHTDHIGLFVNHESKKSKQQIESHPFISTLMHELDKLCGGVYLDTGKDINSHWHVRRSDFLVCNSQIYIIYLIGTHKVSYN